MRHRGECGKLSGVKLLILYRPNSEHASTIESYVRDFQRQHGADKKVEMQSLNTREGAATATLYDIMSYPAILALADDGSVLNAWEGDSLPLMDEVASYIYA
ncbi:MAG TPA: hypothetical protein VHT70_00100 [Candidatus Saccharimonadales bacterium]|jgi:hypothetical protein|nr:hypothetical protein [Candidatus Saccharimonadales bacterium]